MSSERTYGALAAVALVVAFIAAIGVAHCTGPTAPYTVPPGPFVSGDTPGGGNDPLPEFETAAAEMTFRGTTCRQLDEEGRQAMLYRDCGEPEDR